MEIGTCIKYLDFVSNECDRHLRDGNVSDDELTQLVVEFQRFKVQINASKLPNEIKNKIDEIEIKYSVEGIERSSWYFLLALITFGIWAIIIYMRKQSNRKRALNEIKFDTSRLASFIKLNY